MKRGFSSRRRRGRMGFEAFVRMVIGGIATHARLLFGNTGRRLMILMFSLVTPSVWAGEDFATNDLAYLGPRPGPRTLTPRPAATPAAESGGNESVSGSLPWWERPQLIGNWWHWRSALETNGLAVTGRYLMDTSVVLDHDSARRGIQRGLLDTELTFDPEPLLGIHGGTFFAQYYYRFGPNGSDVACDLQGFDNLDAGPFNQVEEIWYEQKLLHGHLRLKAGQVDANAEFDNLTSAAGFIHSSAGFSPALLNFPTYPNPALSANLFAYPTEWFYCGAGVYADNLRRLSAERLKHPYLIGEAGLTHLGTGHFGPGRVAAGVWKDTEELSRFDGSLQAGTAGVYLVAEQQVWKRLSGAPEDKRGVSLFVQYARANPSVSPVADHLGVGVSATGLLSARENDAMGIYWSRAGLSHALEANFTHDEASLEAFYQCQITPFLILKPDLQWIKHPRGQCSPDAAWVVTLRVILNF